MSNNRDKRQSTDLSDLIKQPAEDGQAPIKNIDPPEGRFGASTRIGDQAPRASHDGAATAFTAGERSLINAYLNLKGYPEAETAEDPRNPGETALMSQPDDDSAPAIVIGKSDGAYWFALIEEGDDDGDGPVSEGLEGIESLPLVLAMIEHPDLF